MARNLIAETKVAVGSLIPGVPFLVFNEETYTGLTATQVTALTNRNEVRGAHNVASDTIVAGLHDIVLHQIRIKNASDAGLRPAWSAVDAAEIAVQNDNALAVTKRDTIYSSFATPIAGVVGQIISGLPAGQHRDAISFDIYMGRKGLVLNGKGRIVSLLPNTKAPMELHYLVDFDSDDWMLVSINSQYSDFIS